MAQLTFAYTALDAAGARRSGAIDAESRDSAIARLAADGRYVLDIAETKENQSSSVGGSVGTRQPSREDLALFTRRLADLALAGLPLDRALSVLAEQSENGILKHVCTEALTHVQGGMPVSEALAQYPRYFNQVFTQTLRAGEASGQFGEVATRLADYQEKDVTRRSTIGSALVYPVILATVAVGVIIFLITFVVPRLSGVFTQMGNDLPITTRILLATSDALTRYWLPIVIVVALLVISARSWFSTAAGQETRDKMLLTAPIIGPIITKATISRFARVLGTLLYGGVPILQALEIAGLSASNIVFLKSALAVTEDIKAGRPIATSMRDNGHFPPVLTHMVAVGEETGDLPKMLGRVADSLDFEVDTGMRRLIALVEPVIILTMGTVVGFVVLSVLLPIYQAQNLVH